MMIVKLRGTMEGISPLLMHNSRLADPLEPTAQTLKEFTKKRVKTLADHQAVARAEWFGSLYEDGEGHLVIPDRMLEAVLKDGGKATKNGKNVERGAWANTARLEYDGPKDLDALYDLSAFRFRVSVVVQRNRVMRTRPIFRTWKCPVELSLDDTLIDAKTVQQAFETGAMTYGIGDWRPKFGRAIVTWEGAK